MAAPAEGRYPVTEAEETTRDWADYAVACPECGEPAGYRCIYTSGPDSPVSAYGRPRGYLNQAKFHLRGDRTVRPHHARANRAAAVRLRAAVRARRKQAPPPKPVLPVTDGEAYEVKCPLCGSEPKRRCTRIAAKKRRELIGAGYTGRWITVHRKGSRTARPHAQRRAEAARLRLGRWKKANPRAVRREDTEQARTALAAFDRAEYEQLRAWLAEHGPILWGGTRPDGSPRGGTYAFSAPVRRLSRGFSTSPGVTVAVITSSQYHTLIASLVITMAGAALCLGLAAWPKARRPGQLPWRRWAWHVPRRHAAVLAVLREDYRTRPGAGLAGREIERRSGARCARAVLRRLTEAGWAERTRHPGITPWHMDRCGYRLTAAGWTGSARVTGAHLPGEVEALQAAAEPRGRHTAPVIPGWHPSAPQQVIRPNGLTEVRPRD